MGHFSKLSPLRHQLTPLSSSQPPPKIPCNSWRISSGDLCVRILASFTRPCQTIYLLLISFCLSMEDLNRIPTELLLQKAFNCVLSATWWSDCVGIHRMDSNTIIINTIVVSNGTSAVEPTPLIANRPSHWPSLGVHVCDSKNGNCPVVKR